MSGNVVQVRKADDGRLKQRIEVGSNFFFADEAEAIGGDNQGPNPHDLLNAALGACTAITVTMVARRKQWPLRDVKVQISYDETDTAYRMVRRIELVGELSEEQKQYLLGIANKCPIHKALHKPFEIESALTG